MVGFYALAAGLVFGLLYIPYAEWVYAHRVTARIAIFCVAGAAVILWSILPRPEKFVAPGPRLDPDAHPRLFEALRSIAGAAGQEMPVDVYLVGDVNAWVAEAGGVLGVGGRRIMGLGLPLLRLLTLSQLRAVLAHELGHYHGGDTSLGPWIYRTRIAIVRTVRGLAQHSSILQMPFVWYGNLFLRLSHAVSRRQELAADALAARTAGANHLASGLTAIHGAAPTFRSYWDGEVAPLLAAGYLPPIADGFVLFLKAPPVVAAVARRLEKESGETAANAYDTHPPLHERIAALKDLPRAPEPEGDPPAITLLEDVAGLEGRLLGRMAGEENVSELKRVHWEEIGAKVYLPAWESVVRQEAPALMGMTAASIPEKMAEPRAFGRHAAATAKRALQPFESARFASAAIGAALALTLRREGWKMRAVPGAPVAFLKGDLEIEPFTVPQKLNSGHLRPEEWRRRCEAAGIAGVELWKAAS